MTLCRWLKFSLWVSLLPASLSRSLSLSGQLGLRTVWNIGMVFLSFLPMSSSDGEYPQARRVDLYANSPLDGSFSVFSSDLVVSTTCSASPLDCGKQGLLTALLYAWNPILLRNEWIQPIYTVGLCHFLLLQWIPCLAKIALRALITLCDLVVFCMAATSIQCEKSSTTIR